LVLTTWADDEWVFEAIRQGASGYLLKGTPRARLLTAIHETAAGQTPIDPAIGAKLFSLVPPVALLDRTRTAATDGLSDREREILCLVARGMSNLAISRELCLSEGTVRNYVSSVLAKLAVPDRTQAAILALKQGLV
jgi:DNA-binding NarL/FixJ family response regulator